VNTKRIASKPLAALGLAMVASIAFLLLTLAGALNRGYLDVDIQAVDPVSGEVLWTVALEANDAPTLGAHSIITVVGGGVEAIDATGSVRWWFQDGRAKRAVGRSGIVYVTTSLSDGAATVVALDEASGEVLWRIAADRLLPGDQLTLLRDGNSYRVVEAASGDVVAELYGSIGSATFSEDRVAVMVGRSLRIVQLGGETRTLAGGLRRAEILALSGGAVVVDQPGITEPSEPGPRPRILTARDVTTGDVIWEQPVDRYDQAIQDGGVIRLVRRTGTTDVDVATGREHPSSAPTGSIQVVDSDGTSTTIQRLVRLEGVTGPNDYYLGARSPYETQPSSTIAVDAASGDVRWRVDNGVAIAANADLIILDEGKSFVVADAGTGTTVGAVAKEHKTGAALTAARAVILSVGTLTTIAADGEVRTVAAGLDVKTRLAGANNDLVVLDRPGSTASGQKERVVTAYRLSPWEPMWTYRFRSYRTAEIVGYALIITRDAEATTIDLGTGAATTAAKPRNNEPESTYEPPLIAGFDDTTSKLLWVSGFGEIAGVIDGAVVMARITSRDTD